jgi:hypothetical protein
MTSRAGERSYGRPSGGRVDLAGAEGPSGFLKYLDPRHPERDMPGWQKTLRRSPRGFPLHQPGMHGAQLIEIYRAFGVRKCPA